MKRFTILLSLICVTLISFAQRDFEPDMVSDKNPWTQLSNFASDTTFQFAVISDLTGGYRQGIFPKAVQKINLVQPDFVMSVGDLIEGYTQDTAQIYRWWNQFDGWLDELESPFFYVGGNHDLSNPLLTEIWEERFGRTYYHFVHRNVLFLCLNAEDGKASTIGQKQVDYVRKTLADHAEVDWTLIFLHKPLWDYGEAGFLQIEEMIQDRPYTFFAGHHHRYIKEVRNDRNHYTLATTGGGSDLAGFEFGRMDHIAWITMTRQGPRVANLMLEGIQTDSVVTKRSFPIARGLLQSTQITHSPLFVPEEENNSVSSEIYFANRGLVPLHLKGNFFQHDLLRVSDSKLDTVLQAGEELSWPVQIDIADNLDLISQPPLILDWSMKSQDGSQIYKQSGQHEIRFMPRYEIPLATQAIQLDGQWKEWASPQWLEPGRIDYYDFTYEGSEDCRFATQISRDTENIYFALKVEDDDALYNPLRQSWEQDGGELSITLPNQKSFRVGFCPGETVAKQLIDHAKNWPAKESIAALRTEDGFVAELSIPLSVLETLNEGPLNEIQLQWIVFDHDGMEDQYKGSKIFWPLPHPGSGVYVFGEE